MTYREIILHLSLIENLGPVAIRHIRQKLDSADLSILYRLSVSDLMREFGLTELTSKRLFQGLRDQTLLDKERTLIDKHAISWICIEDDK